MLRKELQGRNVSLNLSIQVDSEEKEKIPSVDKKSSQQSHDDDSEEVNIFQNPEGNHAGLKITKLLIVTGVSLLDVFTDFLFGFNLLFDFENRWNSELKAEAAAYGYIVLLSCWIPGLVAVIHMAASYRKNYVNKKREFAVTLFLLFVLYPLAPFFSLFISLWYFNDPKDRKIGKVERIINLAIKIEGCVESPIQLILTIFLIMKGILNVPWTSSEEDSVIDLGFQNKISLHGVLPVVTIIASSMSILKATITMNVFSVLLIHSREGYLPFFCHAIYFRVLAFAFILIYLDKLAFFVFLPILLSNVWNGYRNAPTIKMNKKLKKYMTDKGQNPSAPIWLNSLTGVLVPSCHMDIIDQKAVKESNDKKIIEMSNKFHKTYQKGIMKWQIILSTSIILMAVIIIAILVNFTNYKYHPNIYTNLEFNVFCLVLGILGVTGLISLKDIDFWQIVGLTEKKENQFKTELPGGKITWILLKSLTIFLASFSLLSPAIGGYIFCRSQAPPTAHLIFNSRYGRSLNMTVLEVKPVFLPSEKHSFIHSSQWSPIILCTNENYLDILDCEEGKYNFIRNASFIIDMNTNGELCYNQLLNSVPEKINCLQIQNIIILEKQIFQSSQSGAIIAPGSFEFPILSVSFLSRKSINLNNLLHNQVLIKLNEEIRRCDIINSKTSKILLGLGDHTCLVGSKNLQCGLGCVRLEGCYGFLGWDIRAKCFKNGKPCPDFSSLFNQQQDVSQCHFATSPTKKAVLITSGFDFGTNEVFHPQIDLGSCYIPKLRFPVAQHSLTSFKICGGSQFSTKIQYLDICTMLNQGKWEFTNKLSAPRQGHATLETKNGILLLGGVEIRDDAEMVKYIGKTESTFKLVDSFG